MNVFLLPYAFVAGAVIVFTDWLKRRRSARGLERTLRVSARWWTVAGVAATIVTAALWIFGDLHIPPGSGLTHGVAIYCIARASYRWGRADQIEKLRSDLYGKVER